MIPPVLDPYPSQNQATTAPAQQDTFPSATQSHSAIQQRAPLPAKTGLLHSFQSLIYIIVVAIFIITFCVQPFRIPSGSMEPTLLIGDFLLVNKQSPATDNAGLLPSVRIHRGDIVIFHYPVNPDMDLIKRVVGLPGDHLKLRDGHVFINGTPLLENYAVYRPSTPDNFRDNFPRLQSADPDIDSHWWIRMRNLIDNDELIIPSGNYFVLGDNRNDSEDSRYWGFVPRANIVGKPLLIYFSLRQGSDDSSVFAGTTIGATSSQQDPAKLDTITAFARWSRTLQIVK